MSELKTLMTGIVFGESPRWGDDDRLWFADWGAQEIIAVDLEGNSEAMVGLRFPSFQAICIDWLQDGRLLIVSSSDALLLRREPDGSLATHADLSGCYKFHSRTLIAAPHLARLMGSTELERAHILATLKETRWVLSGPDGAATRLGMHRSTLQFRLKKLRIIRPGM
jgi:Bacterial regulatory protein, Fis family